MEYAFNLKFKLAPEDADHERIMSRLGESGCTDALVGLGAAGHVGLEFIREAQSAEAAVLSALEDVRKALPDARLIEAGPDFVGLTDVADLVGMSRQNMRKLMTNNSQAFPAPVHSGSPAIWHLAHVLQFMGELHYEFTESIFEVACTAMQVNITKERSFLDAKVEEQVRSRLYA